MHVDLLPLVVDDVVQDEAGLEQLVDHLFMRLLWHRKRHVIQPILPAKLLDLLLCLLPLLHLFLALDVEDGGAFALLDCFDVCRRVWVPSEADLLVGDVVHLEVEDEAATREIHCAIDDVRCTRAVVAFVVALEARAGVLLWILKHNSAHRRPLFVVACTGVHAEPVGDRRAVLGLPLAAAVSTPVWERHAANPGLDRWLTMLGLCPISRFTLRQLERHPIRARARDRVHLLHGRNHNCGAQPESLPLVLEFQSDAGILLRVQGRLDFASILLAPIPLAPRQQAKIRDAVDASLPPFHLAILHQNILVLKERDTGRHWRLGYPEVPWRPRQLILVFFPVTQLRNGTNHAEMLTILRFVLDLEAQGVACRAVCVIAVRRPEDRASLLRLAGHRPVLQPRLAELLPLSTLLASVVLPRQLRTHERVLAGRLLLAIAAFLHHILELVEMIKSVHL